MSKRAAPTEGSGVLTQPEAAFRRYSPELYRYVLRRLRRPADAADLTQEIFERFLRGEGSAKVLNPQAYLFGIAANVVADACMAEGRSRVMYDTESSEQLGDALLHALPDLAERVELEQELQAALAQLPDAHLEGLHAGNTADEDALGQQQCRACAHVQARRRWQDRSRREQRRDRQEPDDRGMAM